ncbi:hypothetical protein HDU84_000748 [Entophlyctis sp. JEL0112]|nr:hypothetical protein HDU84_000748 [Entophlyctis sp. JEL0112]
MKNMPALARIPAPSTASAASSNDNLPGWKKLKNRMFKNQQLQQQQQQLPEDITAEKKDQQEDDNMSDFDDDDFLSFNVDKIRESRRLRDAERLLQHGLQEQLLQEQEL